MKQPNLISIIPLCSSTIRSCAMCLVHHHFRLLCIFQLFHEYFYKHWVRFFSQKRREHAQQTYIFICKLLVKMFSQHELVVMSTGTSLRDLLQDENKQKHSATRIFYTRFSRCVNRWEDIGGPVPRPARSLDLNTLHSFLLRNMKQFLYSRHFINAFGLPRYRSPQCESISKSATGRMVFTGVVPALPDLEKKTK